jgi:hypothetical protein
MGHYTWYFVTCNELSPNIKGVLGCGEGKHIVWGRFGAFLLVLQAATCGHTLGEAINTPESPSTEASQLWQPKNLLRPLLGDEVGHWRLFEAMSDIAAFPLAGPQPKPKLHSLSLRAPNLPKLCP